MLSLTTFRILALASIVLLSSGSCNLCKAQAANNKNGSQTVKTRMGKAGEKTGDILFGFNSKS